MKELKAEMIKIYKINKLGYDFMGYTFKNQRQLSYHHLIVPKRFGGQETVSNGAILRQNTSHDYLHKIEDLDPEIFQLITEQMIQENLKCRLDIDNLKRIRDLLLYFEKEHKYDTTKKGKRIIQREYIRERIDIWK